MDIINEVSEPAAIIDEAEAGRAAKVRKEITKLIDSTNEATFDLMDLLQEAKAKNYFRKWGFESFSTYAKSLKLKYSKSFYLVSIKNAMLAAGVPRESYEPIGLAKLRIIAELKPDHEYNGVPGSLAIHELAMKAGQLTTEEIKLEVDTLQGKVADDSIVWLNISLKKIARDNVLRPAIDLAKKHIGSVGVDDDGVAKDASDGAALEVICANFLADPNFAEPTYDDTVGHAQGDEIPEQQFEPTEDDSAEIQADTVGGNALDDSTGFYTNLV
jgi:hypothetical protein